MLDSSTSDESVSRILVGEDTYLRLGGAFRAVDLGSHALSGKHEETRIFRVVGEATGEARHPEGGSPG